MNNYAKIFNEKYKDDPEFIFDACLDWTRKPQKWDKYFGDLPDIVVTLKLNKCMKKI